MKIFFLTIFLLICALGLWALIIEPYALNVKKITIKNSPLNGLKVVFASDFHIKPYEGFRLRKIVRTINAQKPDIVLLGGDYINGTDNYTMDIEDIADELSKIKSPMGTYAVLGNHDGWFNARKVEKILKINNIKVLANTYIEFPDFVLSGVEDFQTQHAKVDLAIPQTSKPIIFLTHHPDVFEQVPDGTFLTLAGHLHGGQVDLPVWGKLVVPSKFGQKFVEGSGFIKENGKMIYTSKGLGTSILPVRFRAVPEIVVIKFK